MKYITSVVFLYAMVAMSAMAQTTTNSNAPIEITADTLEVFREENKAVFEGEVVAVQEQMQLHSDKMIVYYENNDKEIEAVSDKASAGSGISSIDAIGSVFLSTPSETAQGKLGHYDLDKKQVTLNNDVILTKGKNVVKGDHFVYNLATGHSKVWSKKQDTSPKNGESPSEAQKKQRVRGVFVPGG